MSGTGALRLFKTAPTAMWDCVLGPDLDRELESSRGIAADAINENAEAHRVLDDHDPDPDPGEPLHERLARVLGPRPTALES